MGFKIDFLDHVAIRVKDLEASAAWYEKILGLRRFQPPKWGDYPIFMRAGTSGVALFPASEGDPVLDLASRNVKIDHFAFQVSRKAFEEAQRHYESQGQEFQIQDHHYFHSIYTRDPDGHTVELTTLIEESGDFYNP
jgi:catechol 2,3-dioxygenase-like lactoylglutathione lyase family enzyme